MGPLGGPAPEDTEAPGRQRATLNDIGELLTRVQSGEEIVRAVIALMRRALRMRTVLVVLRGPGAPLTIADAADGADVALAEVHALAAYAYLVGPREGPRREDEATLPCTDPSHTLVLPIVVETRPVFGVMRVETTEQPSEQDLMFVNAVVNQLALALDWRTYVEARRASAEAATSRAEVGQAAAERLQERAEALSLAHARLLHLAEHASRAREEFLAVVAHDLRNQVNTILMSVTLLLRRRPKGEQERRTTNNMVTIQRTALDMSRLIGDLLDVASIDSGNLAVTLGPEAVGPLVQGALDLLEEQAAAKSLRLSSDVAAPEMRVVCDRQRIQQVFANLIGNAIKFTQPGGAIRIRVAPDAQGARFAISDTGAGMTGEQLAHAFDRFWRGGRTARSGSGLGLAITKGIIASHGGTIWLESQVGVGTTVYFTLPFAPLD